MLSKKVLRTGAGVVLGLVGGKLLTSNLAKKTAVGAVASGLRVKDSLDKTIEQARVSADDIVAEAKDKNTKEDLERAKKEAELDLENLAKEDLIEELKEEVKAEMKAEIKAEMEAKIKAEMEAKIKAEMEAEMKAEMEAKEEEDK